MIFVKDIWDENIGNMQKNVVNKSHESAKMYDIVKIMHSTEESCAYCVG